MNKKMKRNVQIAACCIALFVCVAANAQVTIGSGERPVTGALLDLKSQSPNSLNITSEKGGLVLPRVELQDKTTLEPFIPKSSQEWTTNQSDTKRKHIGLLVYNLKEDNFFHPGIYVWYGESWVAMKATSEFFYLPSFNLEWKDGGSVELFDVYKENYKPAAVPPATYESSTGAIVDLPGYDADPTHFDYVVTYYDPTIITIKSISPTGKMEYDKTPGVVTLPEDTYINIVMIRK
ncbi:hypothetical protein FACS189432_04010 [Bacteroidia bacterium]|nr:hypothetical protein FACS189426_10970 [Bacteroidia bacterium]GHT27443.1 hypothetical protein FACS189432_04010 [Bacteroidia bacterium]GHV71098.1 hypothetical protein FACS189420_4890 [Bacteroidia bacterium]